MPDANKVTFVQRKNTVCIDIKQVAGLKVPSKDWVTFLKDDVKLKAEDVVECQVHSVTGFLLVKLRDELLYQEVCDRLQPGIPWSIGMERRCLAGAPRMPLPVSKSLT